MMNHTLRRGLPWSPLLLLVLLLPFVVCPAEKLAPVWVIRSDPYQIEILTPGGVFRQGENAVEVRAWRNGQPAEMLHGHLSLSMVWLDAKPHMHTQALLCGDASPSALEGRLHFDMDGIWDGRVEVTTPTKTIAAMFRTEVVE